MLDISDLYLIQQKETEASALRADILKDFREPGVAETYDQWVAALNAEYLAHGVLPFNPSHEQASADATNRHIPEDWHAREVDFMLPF